MDATGPGTSTNGGAPLGRTLFLVWILSTIPAAGFVALVLRSDAAKADFVRMATARAEGTVLRRIEQRGKDLRYVPIVGFPAADGRRVEFRSRYFDRPAYGQNRYAVGARVAVVYVPSDPARAEIDDPRLREKDATPFLLGGSIYVAFMTLVCGGLALGLRPKVRATPAPGSGPLAPR